MKQKIRDHIDQLNVNNGGGIISEKIRVDTIDNPMLVIGLGGTGIDALLRLKYQINRRFVLPKDGSSNRYEDKPKNIEFVGIETNLHDKDKRYPELTGIGLDPNKELILISNSDIGPMIRSKELMEECIKDWLNPGMTPANGTNGAGGIRQLGRLLLFSKVDYVIQNLERKIRGLQIGNGQRLIVFILSGVSGGTGSGCFIDIPYIVRGIMERKYGNSAIAKYQILGYLFTPDVNLERENMTPPQAEIIKKNGYAALKELDYLMNIDERGERFIQDYRGILNVNSEMPPYDLCHLVSAYNINQVHMANSYDYCMNVTAENITNFMSNEEKIGGKVFAIHDYLSNIEANINTIRKPFHANFKYNIIGASSAVLPIEEITTYLAYKLFDKMSSMFGNEPKQNDIDDFISIIKLDKDSVSKRFDYGLQEPLKNFEQNQVLYSYNNVILTDAAGVMDSINKHIIKAELQYMNLASQLPDEMVQEFRKKAEEMFMDPKKGPFFVNRVISSDKGFNIIKSIQALIKSIESETKNVEEQIGGLERMSGIKFEEARSAMLFGRERKKNDYIKARLKECRIKVYEKKLINMKQFYISLIPIILGYNNDLFYVFTEILDKLNKIFKENGNILTNSQTEINGSHETYYWNVISIPEISRAIDTMINERNAEELIRDFATELLREAKGWIDENAVSIVDSISNFLTDKFGEIISKSMEDFLKMKYGEDMNVKRITEKEIASKLNDSAVPVYYMENSINTIAFPSWGMVSLPMKSNEINNGILSYQQDSLGNTSFTIKESKVTNRIFWLNTFNGVPLYTYSPLRLYETAYENTIFTAEGIGRHLVQNDQKNWAYLPSPIPEKSWGEQYCVPRIKEYNSKVRDMFRRATTEPPFVIVERGDDARLSNQFQCIETEMFDTEEFVNKYNFDFTNRDNINYDKLIECIERLTNILKNGLVEKKRLDIFNSFDSNAAKENLIRHPSLFKIVEAEIEKYDSIRTKLGELQKIVDNAKKLLLDYDTFFKALLTNTICKKGLKYVYDLDVNEKDNWKPFASLMDSDKYFEVVIFKNYCSLDEKQRKIIDDKAAKRFETLIDDIPELMTRIDELLPIFNEKKNELEDSSGGNFDVKEKHIFYSKIYSKIIDIKNKLDS